jgi:DNA gyrase subunit A
MMNLIKKELSRVREKFADNRKTKLIKSGVKNISLEDLIPDEESVLVLSKGGYVKRTNPDEYKKQKRGGVGVIDLDTKDEDFVYIFLNTTTHSDLLFFSDKGKAYQIKMYDIPEGRRATKGKSVMNFISLGSDEKITSVLAMPKEIKKGSSSIMMITRDGITKKVDAQSFFDVRRSGIIGIKLNNDDKLVSASFVSKGDDLMVVTSHGQSIRFKENDIREMGRNAAGVRGVKLDKKDTVVAALPVQKENQKNNLLVFSENGFGKQTPLDEYKTQKRGGSGIKTAKVTEKIGKIMSAVIVTDETDEVVAISQKGQVIRVDVDEIPILGRQTQGVRVMKLRAGDSIASVVCL